MSLESSLGSNYFEFKVKSGESVTSSIRTEFSNGSVVFSTSDGNGALLSGLKTLDANSGDSFAVNKEYLQSQLSALQSTINSGSDTLLDNVNNTLSGLTWLKPVKKIMTEIDFASSATINSSLASYSLTSEDRILINDRNTHNGIYVYSLVNEIKTLTRSTDFASVLPITNQSFMISSGEYANSLWTCISAGSTVGDNISFQQISLPNLAENSGLIISNNSIKVGGSVGNTVDFMNDITCKTITATSDERLKENIQPIEDALAKLSLIEPVYYNWKDQRDTFCHAGVLAQQVEKVDANTVRIDANGQYSVDYNHFIGLLIASQKEMLKKIEHLEFVCKSVGLQTNDTLNKESPTDFKSNLICKI